MRLFGLATGMVLAAFAGGLSADQARATVLTFDIDGATDFQNFSDLYQRYGDRVGDPTFDSINPQFHYGSGGGPTNNVQVVYTPGLLFATSRAPSARIYGNLENVLYRQFGGNNIIEIGLFADSGFDVELFSFDLAAVLSTAIPARFVRVENAAGQVLWQDPAPSGGVSIPAVDAMGNPTRKTYDFVSLLGAPIRSNAVRILVDTGQISTKVDRIGIDNVKFGQTPPPVPTPGAVALLACGAALAARRRR